MRHASAGTESSQLVKGGLWAKGREECKTRGHCGLSGPHAGFKRFSLRNSPDVTTALWTIQHFSFLLQSEKVFKSECQGIFWVDKFSLSCITSFEIIGTEKRKWCFPPKWKPQYVLETWKIVPRKKKKGWPSEPDSHRQGISELVAGLQLAGSPGLLGWIYRLHF